MWPVLGTVLLIATLVFVAWMLIRLVSGRDSRDLIIDDTEPEEETSR